MAKTWNLWLSFPAAVWGTRILGQVATTCFFLTLSLPYCIPVPLIQLLCYSLSQQQAKGYISKDQKKEGLEIRSVMFITRRYSERYTKSVIVSHLFNMCQNQLATTSVVKLEVSVEDLDTLPPEYTYLVSPP